MRAVNLQTSILRARFGLSSEYAAMLAALVYGSRE